MQSNNSTTYSYEQLNIKCELVLAASECKKRKVNPSSLELEEYTERQKTALCVKLDGVRQKMSRRICRDCYNKRRLVNFALKSCENGICAEMGHFLFWKTYENCFCKVHSKLADNYSFAIHNKGIVDASTNVSNNLHDPSMVDNGSDYYSLQEQDDIDDYLHMLQASNNQNVVSLGCITELRKDLHYVVPDLIISDDIKSGEQHKALDFRNSFWCRRQAVKFNFSRDDYDWKTNMSLFWVCSCTNHYQLQLNPILNRAALGIIMTVEESKADWLNAYGLNSQGQDCIHARLLERLMPLDIHDLYSNFLASSSLAAQSFGYFEDFLCSSWTGPTRTISDGSILFASRPFNSIRSEYELFAMVELESLTSYKCFLCNRRQHDCVHTEDVRETIFKELDITAEQANSIDAQMNAERSWTEEVENEPDEKVPYVFDYRCRKISPTRPTELQQRKLEQRSLMGLQALINRENVINFAPDIPVVCSCSTPDKCVCGFQCPNCCAPWSEPIKDCECDLFHISWSVNKCNVFYRSCSQCSHVLRWDGHADAIFRFSKTMAVTYELAFQYLNTIFSARLPTWSCYQVMRKTFEYTCNQQFLTPGAFQTMAWSLLRNLDDDYITLFSCPLCGDASTTPIIICDGTALAIQSNLAKFPPREQVHNNAQPKKGTDFADRIFISDSLVREAIMHFLGDATKNSKATRFNITGNEASELKTLVEKRAKFLSPLVNEAIARTVEENPANGWCIQPYRSLLRNLARKSAVAGGFIKKPFALSTNSNTFLPKLYGEGLENDAVLSNNTVRDWLEECCPALRRFFDGLGCKKGPEYLVPVLKELQNCCNILSVVPQEERERSTNGVDVSLAADEAQGYFYPGMRQEWPTNAYTMPTRNQNVNADGVFCTKTSLKHPSLLPGIFAMFCPHGICLGFHLMRQAESPETVFTLLYTRRAYPPVCVVYDNGCNLFNYCMNREPFHFRYMSVYVDRVHWPNHVGCSVGFNLDSFEEFEKVNSIVAEQCNSFLDDLKSQCSYMRLDNFMVYLKCYLAHFNRTKLMNLQLALPNQGQDLDKLPKKTADLLRVNKLVNRLKSEFASLYPANPPQTE